MVSIDTPSRADYRQILKNELARRRAVNPRYSLRAFARSLALNPGFLSSVLSGGRNFSLPMLAKVAQRLGMSGAEANELMAAAGWQRFDEGLGSNTADEENLTTLQLDTFQTVSDWHHFAILELTHVRGFNGDPAWIARRLGIDVAVAAEAIDRLLRLGMLARVGSGSKITLRKTSVHLATPSGQASRPLRSFHAQHLEKAKEALESQSVEERDITGITIPFNPERIAEASREIRSFRRRMGRIASTGDTKEVYHLSIAFFRLSQNSKPQEQL